MNLYDARNVCFEFKSEFEPKEGIQNFGSVSKISDVRVDSIHKTTLTGVLSTKDLARKSTSDKVD